MMSRERFILCNVNIVNIRNVLLKCYTNVEHINLCAFINIDHSFYTLKPCLHGDNYVAALAAEILLDLPYQNHWSNTICSHDIL